MCVRVCLCACVCVRVCMHVCVCMRGGWRWEGGGGRWRVGVDGGWGWMEGGGGWVCVHLCVCVCMRLYVMHCAAGSLDSAGHSEGKHSVWERV